MERYSCFIMIVFAESLVFFSNSMVIFHYCSFSVIRFYYPLNILVQHRVLAHYKLKCFIKVQLLRYQINKNNYNETGTIQFNIKPKTGGFFSFEEWKFTILYLDNQSSD